MGGIKTSLPSIPDEATHSTYRKLVSSAYSMSALKDYEPYIDEITDRWLAVFDQFAKSGEALNITEWSHYCRSLANAELAVADAVQIALKSLL
jgi:hypothetical protein